MLTTEPVQFTRVGVGFVLAGLIICASAVAGKRNQGAFGAPPNRNSIQQGHANSSKVLLFLTNDLSVEDPTEYHLTQKTRNKIEHLPQASRDLSWVFAPQSAKTLGEIFKAFGRTEYSNAIVLGPAGVGKSFLIEQLVALYSFGAVPDFLKAELGILEGQAESPYQIQRESMLGKTDIVLINMDLLSQDNTRSGKAFSSESVRMRTILTGLFRAAREEFNRTDSSGKRIGRRTIFVIDEVATLPDLVQQTLKKVLDETGFRNPHDAVLSQKDPGFAVMAMTTPDEYRAMVKGDSAVERRYKKVTIAEPTEVEAFRIVRGKADKEWAPLYGLQVSDEAIRFLVRMRKFLTSPPLAMPASVLAATNDLFLWRAGEGGSGEIRLRDAQEFLMRRAGLTEIWFEGPRGEPPFYDFAERVKKRVIGQDEVIERISDRLKAWARMGFGGKVPVFFLGGSSGSGKDTLLRALNEVMFGHDGRHLMFSIGGTEGFGINAIIEGPPIGNHSDGEQGLLVKALENGPANGIIAFNEGKDAPSEELEKLKVFIESGEIRPKGKDARVRPLLFPIFILGQWGEELFDHKSDADVAKTYREATQDLLESQFLNGKGGRFGKVSPALLNRAKESGGVFVLKPVPRETYPAIVNITLQKIFSHLRLSNNIELTVSPALVELVARTAIQAGQGTRALGGTLIDFTETAISKAQDQGLALRDVAITVDHELGPKGDMVVVRSGDRTWKFETRELMRIKLCESKLLNP